MLRASVATIVVDWNTGPPLRRCLEALTNQTLGSRSVLVDNGSITTASPDPALPRTHRLLRLGENQGFARATNRGIALEPDVEWIALLNPDAFPEPDWLERLLSAAESHPEYSFFASRQLMAEDPRRLDGAGDVYATSGLAWRRGHGREAAAAELETREVFGACAAAALYRREALEEAGLFDESFFCYFEDVDLAFRLRLLGHRCLYVPDAVVHHVGSAASGRRSDFSVYHGHRNLVWAYFKNMPWPLLLLYWPQHLLLNLVCLVRFTAAGQGKAIWRAEWDAVRGLPRVLRQRRAIQARRKVSAWELRRVMVRGWRAFGIDRLGAAARAAQ